MWWRNALSVSGPCRNDCLHSSLHISSQNGSHFPDESSIKQSDLTLETHVHDKVKCSTGQRGERSELSVSRRQMDCVECLFIPLARKQMAEKPVSASSRWVAINVPRVD
ncbi:hypothetical protein AVEN_142957-1 [Araneus ventricosus]|uniref:Uncharacterized protein n=1 Tax=Araneus ventricosus TaxID=182803 RepID=A0A4Y2M6L2_ARAVE|nr:hypothetical protein AVEN_142957-1 [Araneus ventricosus]